MALGAFASAWIHPMQGRRCGGALHMPWDQSPGWRDLWGWEAQPLVPHSENQSCWLQVCLSACADIKLNLLGWRFCILSRKTVPVCK